MVCDRMLVCRDGMLVCGGQKAHYELGGSEEGVRRGCLWPHLLGIYFRDKLDSLCVLVFGDKLGSNVMCLGLSDHSFNSMLMSSDSTKNTMNLPADWGDPGQGWGSCRSRDRVPSGQQCPCVGLCAFGSGAGAVRMAAAARDLVAGWAKGTQLPQGMLIQCISS